MGYYSYCIIYGIVSNRCQRLSIFAHDLVDSYGISPKQHHVFKGTCNMIPNENTYIGFKGDEVIRMEYMISNRNKCKLSFYNESSDNK